MVGSKVTMAPLSGNRITVLTFAISLYFTDSSEKVEIAISLARIYVNNVAPISVDACLVHSDKLRTWQH